MEVSIFTIPIASSELQNATTISPLLLPYNSIDSLHHNHFIMSDSIKSNIEDAICSQLESEIASRAKHETNKLPHHTPAHTTCKSSIIAPWSTQTSLILSSHVSTPPSPGFSPKSYPKIQSYYTQYMTAYHIDLTLFWSIATVIKWQSAPSSIQFLVNLCLQQLPPYVSLMMTRYSSDPISCKGSSETQRNLVANLRKEEK